MEKKKIPVNLEIVSINKRTSLIEIKDSFDDEDTNNIDIEFKSLINIENNNGGEVYEI